MANSVNDVMNVIASPDYGIKNIAGTNQEILAILSGTHNSKNNIHAIVNDIKILLQKFISVSTEKKPIEMDGDKVSKSNQLANPKNIQNIIDETKNIGKLIDNLTKSIIKQSVKGSNPAVAKLSDKASQKVADAMVENIKKQNKNGGMTALVDAFTKLRNISIKDIIFGNKKLKSITKIFKNAKKDLDIKEKDLESITKLINAAPEMIKSLSKINRKVNKIIKNDTITKLKDILVGENSILTISKSIKKNNKIFTESNKISKDIKELVSSLKKTLQKLFSASLWTKVASKSINNITTTVNKLINLSTTLNKNKNIINKGTKAAKNLTALTGNLLLSSIFLTVGAVTGIPAILGAKLLSKMVDSIMGIARKLSKNKKHIRKAILSSIGLVVITGSIALTSIILSNIATSTGITAVLGSILVLGIVSISVITFKLLSKSLKSITIGSISMALMSLSLILFGISLNKIISATKNVSFKQIGVIATLTVVLGGAVALLGIPVVFPFIALGSVSMMIMGLALRPFSKTLGIISKETEKLKFKDILLIVGSMLTLATGISGLSLLLGPIMLGSFTLTMINKPLSKFVKTIKIINEMGSIPMNKIKDTLNAMEIIGEFYKKNSLKPKVVRNARRYKKLLSPFIKSVRIFNKLNKMKKIPTELIQNTLFAMNIIANHYTSNPISKDAIKQAKRYKRMLRPFGNTIKHLAKLKKLGEIPLSLVKQTLDTMNIVGKYYTNNPISKDAIKQAKRYKRMLRPFGNTIKYFVKLKKLGELPMSLVNQTLDAMSTIANYYVNNPITNKAKKEAKKYKKIQKQFGKTIQHFVKLKELGEIPMSLVQQTLDTISLIANFYVNNPISKDAIKQTKRYKKIQKQFGKTIKHFSKFKEYGDIPVSLVQQTLDTLSIIGNFYDKSRLKNKAIKQAKRYDKILNPFSNTVKSISLLKEMSSIPMTLVHQILDAMSVISNFYQNQKIKSSDAKRAIKNASRIANIVSGFGKSAESFKIFKDIQTISIHTINDIIVAIGNITSLFNKTSLSNDIELKGDQIKQIINKFIRMTTNIQHKLTKLKSVNIESIRSIIDTCNSIIKYYTDTTVLFGKRKVQKMNEIVKLFFDNTEYFKNGTENFTIDKYINVKTMIKSMKEIMCFLRTYSLNRIEREKAKKNITLLNHMSSALSGVLNVNPSNISSIGDALTNALNGVNKVDISQVQAVTNMFNAFNEINKSENIINKFTQSVNEFTTACKNLMNAMGTNTEAINNIDFAGVQDQNERIIKNNIINMNSTDTANQNCSVHITNVEELAKTIAENIHGALSIEIPDTQVQLLINGTSGNEWTITKY